MYIITIDGPASSGKGTVARRVAILLGFNYLDSGAIYRALGLIVTTRNYDINDTDGIVKLIEKDFALFFKDNQVYLNGAEITQAIRAEQIGMYASILGKNSKIRAALLNYQHLFAAKSGKGLVTDGRDMGSVVFPDAILKVFLTAKAEVRAHRRYQDLQKSCQSVKMEAILRDIMLRDKQDTERVIAPLCYDDTFKVLDNSDLTIEETVSCIVNWFHQISDV